MIEFTLTRTSMAPIETVFDAMTDHCGIANYMRVCRRSSLDREGTPAPNGVGAIRRLETVVGTPFVEKIIEYQQPTRYAYKMVSGLPTRDHVGTIELRETASGTEVSWHLRSTLKIPGFDRLMVPIAKRVIAELLSGGIDAAERNAPGSRVPALSLTPVDESFFTTADFVLPTTIDLPHSPAQIWAALTDDRLGAWMPIVDRARWIDPPPRSRGARRTIRLLRAVTIDEEFHIWEEGRRIAFRALDIRPRIASGWGEQAQLDALSNGGTRLTYTIAINARILRPLPIPGFLTPAAAVLSRRMLRGITAVLPPPTSHD